MSLYTIGAKTGWGNIVLLLSDLYHNCKEPFVHSSINNVKRGVEFSGFTITDRTDLPEYSPKLFINPYYFTIIHPLCRQIIRPSEEMKLLIEKYIHLVEGVSSAVHIRRGWADSDSKDMGHHYHPDGTIRPAYFASDKALEKFIEVIRNEPGKVFLASDSEKTKNMLKQMFPEKVMCLDMKIVLTYECDQAVTDDERLACYLDWFLLSMCPSVHVTGGEPDSSGFSTFGYSAAVYGGKQVKIINNL
jgi:hypothetical protein